MNDIGFYLFFDRIHIQAANAVSSPITYGFPAVTGFLGAVHALSRTLPQDQDIELDGVLIACHDSHVKRYRPHAYADYRFNQSRNPIKKNGNTASIIEEGKVDLTVSLLVEVRCSVASYGWLQSHKATFAGQLRQQLFQQRIAGGSVHRIGRVELKDVTESDQALKAALLPAFVLMDATQALLDITAQLQEHNTDATALDALLEIATLHHIPGPNKSADRTTSVKAGHGWLVPMPVGFQSIAAPVAAGQLTHCRTQYYPEHYVECLYGAGKWVFANRLESIAGSFWRYNNRENDLYLIQQNTL